jgi:hypothetical protein
MPIAVQLVFPGGTTDQYDEVIEKMGFEPGGVANDDAYFHWVTKTDDGLLVTDVWESQEAFGKFAEEQIGPYTAEVGLPEPQVTTYPVHNYLIGGRVAN